MTVFRHQEKIADKMIVWHKPLEGSHVQLAANKLIKIQQKNSKEKSSLFLVMRQRSIRIEHNQGQKPRELKMIFCKR